MLTVTTGGWVAGGVLLVAIAVIVPKDIAGLRTAMQQRAQVGRPSEKPQSV